ncbi:MAG TPA: MipA/OmpV family protein [Sphingomicrobium sp.]|nr:MipA/OmpV family protein [Sphingomicrobium sp.]
MIRHLICVALAASFATPAPAQSAPADSQAPSPDELARKDRVTIGVGGALIPDYEGANESRVIPAGAIRGQISGISFSSQGTYLYVDVIPRGSGKLEFDAGPIAGARMNRAKHHLKDDIVDLLPRRKTAIEAGGFAGVTLHGLTNPYDSLSLHLDVVHDVANTHQSTTFSPAVDFATPLSRTTYVSASLNAEFVGNKYADYYFSITPADSLATAGVLPVFNAGSGMKDWKASLLLNQSLTGDLTHGLSIFGMGSYSRLVGDFKRSPIVSQRGSASQWIAAAGLAHTF